MARQLSLAMLLAWPLFASALEQHTSVNPIRKVVNMLTMMQKKVTAEGEKEKELFDKFMCYCQNSGGELTKSIADAEDKLGELPAMIEKTTFAMQGLKEGLKNAQQMRSAAKAAMAAATALREKEAAEFAKVSSDLKTNIGAIGKAVAAMEKGASAAFLQTEAAQSLRNLVVSMDSMEDLDRHDVTAFLTNSQTSRDPGAIVGILKQMGDTMSQTLKAETAREQESLASYDQLMKAKTKEVEAITNAIERYTPKIGEMGVAIVQMKADLSDTEESLAEDKKFAAELKTSCATKQDEWAAIVKSRNEEILALADTIKILNDDDALELFKKTLPGASSFLQLQVSEAATRSRVLSILREERSRDETSRQHIDFIMLAIEGKKVGFEKVIKMCDKMVTLLKEEGQADADKKEYCEMQFDKVEDKKKGLERTLSSTEAAIEDAKESIGTLKSDIEALTEGIKALDESVEEAAAQRKEENSDYQMLMASDASAKELLAFAKNRLNKFYNPKLYKPPAAAAFVQVAAHRQAESVEPPPAAPGAFKKKSEEGNGVIAMIDLLIKDLDKEMTTAEVEEKNAQEDYEELMADSAAKRAADVKSVTEKTDALGENEELIATKTTAKKAAVKDLMATEKYIGQLHAECDWLLQYFDVRAEARNGEIDALTKAKAVLSGADFSFVQLRATKFLSRQ